MEFIFEELVVKISVSDMLRSKQFYQDILGFIEDERYTINTGGVYGNESFVQMNSMSTEGTNVTIGLYKDIDGPYEPVPSTGTVPSFVVPDIEITLSEFLSEGVKVVPVSEGKYIISNTSDEGYVDHFFFFLDPDNNSLVIRQNLGVE
ncbi:MAG: VOC family protein [Crocinitomicaceae bacterium]